MSKLKKILYSTSGLVAAIFALGGGKLTEFAPPGDFESSFSYFIAFTLLLVFSLLYDRFIFLFKFLNQNITSKTFKTTFSVVFVLLFLFSSYLYYSAYRTSVIVNYDDYISNLGKNECKLTETAIKTLKQRRSYTANELQSNFNLDGPREVWTNDCIHFLNTVYLFFLLSFGLMIFTSLKVYELQHKKTIK